MRLGFKEQGRHWEQGKRRCVRMSDVLICSGRRLHKESDVTRRKGVGFFFSWNVQKQSHRNKESKFLVSS